ncbi:GNAT family N-acetyltransferase [Kocuria sp. KRD140]|uniref:GNAT family N-acetyltransferase n=1 Tax=Kocuria sp. KRD140 TaxID=2729723 RepID=UPI0019D1904C|nr:GNAT family N-acetyltransferase [Kocuria sp. KRD140]
MLDDMPRPVPPQPLRTQRLELRAFTPDELEAVAGGSRLPQFAPGFPTPENEDWAREAIEAGEHFFTESDCALLAVIRLSSGQIIGAAGFAGPAMDHELEIKGSIVPEHQNQGLATEALRALVDRAFEDPGIRAVHGSVPTDHEPARRVLVRCGFVKRPSEGSEDTYYLRRP